MAANDSGYFDLETVSLMREALDDAWFCLRPQERATTSRTHLAEGILAAAAQGERDPVRLIDAALMGVGIRRKAHRAPRPDASNDANAQYAV